MEAPRHRAAQRFSAEGLFRQLGSFGELESRIDQLATPQDRGDAFEVFAEGYIATQRKHNAVEVWPESEIPIAIKKTHGLNTPRDMGVDGVFKTRSGEIIAYQVKYRGGRKALRWGDDLSTFMGQTDQVSGRLLFANSDGVPPVMEERRDFISVLGFHLDELGPEEFDAIDAWLKGRKVERRFAKPRLHQQEAIDGIVSALQENDRTTALMACGTGKTLVGLWTAEKQDVKTVLVLVPSLALVSQTLHEWCKHTSWESFSCLCVCSDPSVTRRKGEDEWLVRQADLDFKVTTDAKDVARFLKGPEEHKIIFTTYQSSQVVGEAIPKRFKFDLGLFDEAHKTAGREGTNFSFALSDKNIAIDKRVFMTATPRHYNVAKRDKEGDAKLVYSMDSEDYGVRGYTLPFSEAADKGIICHYKVIISIVTDEMIDAEQRKIGQVVVDGDAITAQQVANQVALRKAVEKYGVGRIFTFHRNIASAKSFVEDGLAEQLPEFERLHIDGSMSVRHRNERIRHFREADRALISNARCLTEGVDVPAVDMVGFMSPKKSMIDIVQAAGRAMRKSEGKDVGYILLPVYLEQHTNENLEDAIERAGFEEVWDVLAALQEQDDVLAEAIRQMREDKGAKRGYDDSKLRERVAFLGPEIGLEQLRQAITLRAIDRLGSSWDERYGELIAYKVEHGHCNVPQSRGLGFWVFTQRQNYKRGNLNEGRCQRLEELGLDWDPQEEQWLRNYEILLEFYRLNGHSFVKLTDEVDAQLKNWVIEQRTQHNRGSISAQRKKLLDEINFVWNAPEAIWVERIKELQAFKDQFGHTNVRTRDPDRLQLAHWVFTARRAYRAGKLASDRVTQLERLGMIWDPIEASWQESFARLVRFKEHFGHCNVPTSRSSKHKHLGNWTRVQRKNYREGKLDDDKVALLEEVGFIWSPHDAAWELMYEELREFRNLHGHCRIAAKSKEHPKLGGWVWRQRSERRAGKLDVERIQRLDEIGFEWSSE